MTGKQSTILASCIAILILCGFIGGMILLGNKYENQRQKDVDMVSVMLQEVKCVNVGDKFERDWQYSGNRSSVFTNSYEKGANYEKVKVSIHLNANLYIFIFTLDKNKTVISIWNDRAY